jgi:hypothetical protein
MGPSLRLVISKMLAQKLCHAYNIKCLFIDKIKNSANDVAELINPEICASAKF